MMHARSPKKASSAARAYKALCKFVEGLVHICQKGFAERAAIHGVLTVLLRISDQAAPKCGKHVALRLLKFGLMMCDSGMIHV